MMSIDEIYCPICARIIRAENAEDVTDGIHDGYIFVHDEWPHTDNDLTALHVGIQ